MKSLKIIAAVLFLGFCVAANAADRKYINNSRPADAKALKQGSFVIPRGAKNPYWAQKMLAEMSVPQQQAVYASELGYPGLNLEALNYVDPKVKPYLPTQYIDKQFWIDDSWYAENGNKALELWNAWKLKKG